MNRSFTKTIHDLIHLEYKNGVTLDTADVTFWQLIYDKKEHFKNNYDTLSSVSKVLRLRKGTASAMLNKLILAGLVVAKLELKYAGTKKGNEEKAPKRWKFISVVEPESCVPPVQIDYGSKKRVFAVYPKQRSATKVYIPDPFDDEPEPF